ncbi:sulfotransferase 1C4 [Galendromus occidentalis]|uniref:Sulfotransferase 1C4 n=1 Tax=Galendromus occidentalis TaxID=34638 RepID=A0AAJ6VUL3_9ACAR|nr:sulfotransferase 1C4 [Galendromus occidentalis]
MAEVLDMNSIEVPCRIINGHRSPLMFSPESFDAACKYRAHDSDIVLCTYPKCGTTWVQYMMCNLLHYDDFDGDMSTVKDQCPYLELFGTGNLKPGSFYKIHLPFNSETFNPNARYVFVTRNPRDVAVSYYHFTAIIPPGIPGVPKGAYWFPRYAELFLRGEVWHGCYMKYHRDWLKGLREHGKPENVLILVYEKMKKDPRGELIRIANFLGGRAAELVKDEKVVETILERTSVDSMKESVNKSAASLFKKMNVAVDTPNDSVEFVRKGVVGDHANYFTPEISRMFDEYINSDPGNQEVMELFNV